MIFVNLADVQRFFTGTMEENSQKLQNIFEVLTYVYHKNKIKLNSIFNKLLQLRFFTLKNNYIHIIVIFHTDAKLRRYLYFHGTGENTDSKQSVFFQNFTSISIIYKLHHVLIHLCLVGTDNEEPSTVLSHLLYFLLIKKSHHPE